MPFTISHAAIVLPLHRIAKKNLSLTGLVVGSMGPDLEYFTRMEILATYGHLWVKGLGFNILVGLMYCFVFHYLVRNSLIQHLPSILKMRLIPFCSFRWGDYFIKYWGIVIVSLIIGIYSHLFWDAFTHEWGLFAKNIPLLQHEWWSSFKGFKILQYLSSIIGLFYIGCWLIRLEEKPIPKEKFNFNFWMQVTLLTAIISFVRFYYFPIEMKSGNIIVVPIMAGFLSLIIIGLVDQILHQKAQDKS